MQRQLLTISYQGTQWLLATAPLLLPPPPAVLPSTMLCSTRDPCGQRGQRPCMCPRPASCPSLFPEGKQQGEQRWSWCCASTAQKRGSTSVPFQHCFGHKSETQHNRLLRNKLTPSQSDLVHFVQSLPVNVNQQSIISRDFVHAFSMILLSKMPSCNSLSQKNIQLQTHAICDR